MSEVYELAFQVLLFWNLNPLDSDDAAVDDLFSNGNQRRRLLNDLFHVELHPLLSNVRSDNLNLCVDLGHQHEA